MANINDFKVVRAKSLKMFDYLNAENHIKIDVDENTKARLGFYHLVLEAITQKTDFKDVSEDIIDGEYNEKVFGEKLDDLGIDAVSFIKDGGEKEIAFFNFKCKNEFKERNQEETALSRSQKFIQFCTSSKSLNKVDAKVKGKIERVREWLGKNETCNLKLYMVSNDKFPLPESSDEYIQMLKDDYGLEVVSVCLDDIIKFVCGKTKECDCSFLLNQYDFLKFTRDAGSTDESYVVKMNLIDIVRISCDDDTLKKKHDYDDDKCIANAKLDISLLFDNVRGFLGQTSYNKNIQKSLKAEPENFFMFNNGLTIVTEDLNVASRNGKQKFLFTLKKYQLVNGGQTLRSIYEFLKNSRDLSKLEKLRDAQVLVRIFKVSAEDETGETLKSNIAEYTNSQNAIKITDLKSIDYKQIQIENYLKQKGILYVRKAGDVGEIDFPYEKRISMELLAKILYSNQGHPEKVTNQKRKLFVDYYNDIFGPSLDLDSIPDIVNLFYCIKASDKKITEQESCYVLYILKILKSKNTNENILKAIKILKDAEKTYRAKDDISYARKIIQKKFKEHLDKKIKNA